MINKFQAFTRERFYISVALSAVSLALLAFSYSIYSTPKMEPSYEEKKESDIAKCNQFAGFKGYESRLVGRSNLELTDEQLTLNVKTFTDVESIMLACDNLEPQLFCLGLEGYCGLDGKKLVLKYEEPKAH